MKHLAIWPTRLATVAINNSPSMKRKPLARFGEARFINKSHTRISSAAQRSIVLSHGSISPLRKNQSSHSITSAFKISDPFARNCTIRIIPSRRCRKPRKRKWCKISPVNGFLRCLSGIWRKLGSTCFCPVQSKDGNDCAAHATWAVEYRAYPWNPKGRISSTVSSTTESYEYFSTEDHRRH